MKKIKYLLNGLFLTLLIVSCQHSVPSDPAIDVLGDKAFKQAIDETVPTETAIQPFESTRIPRGTFENVQVNLQMSAVSSSILSHVFGDLIYINHNPILENPWSIYVQNQATNVSTLIYSGNREIQSVAIDYTIGFVYFSARETEEPTSDFEIWKVSPSKSRIYRLTNNEVDDLNISVNMSGSRIAWESVNSLTNIHTIRWRNYDVSLTPPTNLGQFRLVTTEALSEPSLTGNGEHIAYVHAIPNRWKVEIYAIGDNSTTEIYSGRYPIKSPSASNRGIKVSWIETLPDRDLWKIKDYSYSVVGSLSTYLSRVDGIEHSHLSSSGKFATYGIIKNGYVQVVTKSFAEPYPYYVAPIFKTLDTGNKSGMFWAEVITPGKREDAILIPQNPGSRDQPGRSLASDGRFAILGAPGHQVSVVTESPGYAFIYKRESNGEWTEGQRLGALDGEAMDYFGESVDISGNYAIVGAPAPANDPPKNGVGYAYIFKRHANGEWIQTQKLAPSDGERYDSFGMSVAIYGNTAMVGADYKGAVYVFRKQADETWAEVQKLVGSKKEYLDQFGCSLDLEGSRVVIGNCVYAQYFETPPSAYIFERQSNGQWKEIQQLVGQGSTRYSQFGYSVSLNGDRIVVGAYEDDSAGLDAGVAHIFERQLNGTWIETQKLSASDSAIQSNFGHGVSVKGDLILVGATGAITDNVTDVKFGAAYLFQYQSDGRWNETQKFVSNLGTYESPWFGWAVALNLNEAIISAPILNIYSGISDGSLGGAMVYQFIQ